ncbi:hypothetical protein K2173_019810 [Erythroxylum novogranatense]|uniref:Uncharacterized protein n=1 Tax=Erythroxylum novogranatense TaxID=1862640 RepID=A0AAV8SM88_9ROSI|nr:hypothetical protein K2173_019810 [Erythroxylum novogranatense]
MLLCYLLTKCAKNLCQHPLLTELLNRISKKLWNLTGLRRGTRAGLWAILAMKKGAHLLKCGRRGKPKVCPFRLSMDEKYLIWYSGHDERLLNLSLVTKVITGQRTANFQRQIQPDKEHQSLSLIYAGGKGSLDLIFKDKVQANSWLIGLRAIISRCQHSMPFTGPRSCIGVQSCVNSPAGYIRRKHNMGILEETVQFSQVRSLCASPNLSLSERCFSDGLSVSSDSFCLSELSLPLEQNLAEFLMKNAPCVEPNLKKCGSSYACSEYQMIASHRFTSPAYGSSQIEKSDTLKDVLIWGEGVGAGNIGYGNHKEMRVDALLPQLLESTVTLDIQNISLGGKHAAIVTRPGEVFCWGEGGGKLGHKVNMDVTRPKLVESLAGNHAKAVACGEYQTCAITHSGELYTWVDEKYGANLVGDVGRKTPWLPRRLFGPLDGISIVNVACGEWHTAIVTSSGQLFTYGDGTFGVLGHGNLQSYCHPKEVESLKGLWVKSVACSSWHTAAIVDVIVDRFKYNAVGGKLFTWGDGDKGRLGHANSGKKLLPTCVTQLGDHNFVQVSCGRMLTVALTNAGKVYTMGSAVHGQLGNPQAKYKSITTVEGKLIEEFVKEISAGAYHVAALTADGTVYTWGKGANGQLGLGSTEDRNSPSSVEALRDRQVVSITCGSNLTAAICLHKSISVTDQSTCSGCRMPFGFARKRHNCYNCGLLFCHYCSNKKSENASLATNKKRPSRVCDSCFKNLQKATNSQRMLQLEGHGSGQLLSPNKFKYDDKQDTEEPISPGGHILSMVQQYNQEILQSKKKILKNQGEKEHLETNLFSVGLPRWGQVPCPVVFRSYCDNSSVHPMGSLCSVSSSLNLEECASESNKMLCEEVKKLKAEVKSLELQCETRNQKIQECQQTIEKAWAMAGEEAAKRKAANEIIKLLASKVSGGREVKDGLCTNFPNLTTAHDSSPVLEGGHAACALTRLPHGAKIPNDRQADSLSSSPIVFSNRLRSITENSRTMGNSDSQMKEDTVTKALKLEWVEQYEPGVYITLTIPPGGTIELKRVRFSRRRFSDKQAKEWWEENQVIVCQKYGIEGYSNTNQSQT